MKILIINGSPAGENSITLQTMHYICKFNPEHTYDQINVGQKIKSVEKDFSEAAEKLKEAELLIFCYPVYTFLVPAQLHRFIELIKEQGVDICGKYATQLSTSKHFYDITAHEFVRQNCIDMKLKYIPGLSADMEDLLKEKGQKAALSFFKHLMWTAENGTTIDVFESEGSTKAIVEATKAQIVTKKTGKRIVIVADLTKNDDLLNGMIKRFCAVAPYECDIVNINEFPFAGGCLGCFHCASDGKCIYKDGFDSFLRENIQTADAIVYAFNIKDHSMGCKFKTFDDRQFCNGHRTVTMGKTVGYLVSGELSKEQNLKMLIEARAQVGGNYLAGVAGNEANTDAQIDRLAAEFEYDMENDYQQPANFYGVGGLKIFRDLIYQMQGMMREDHKFYKAHGFYDFPQKRIGTILGMYFVGAMMRNKKLSKKIGANMTKGMLMPYKKVLDNAKPKQ